MYHVSGRQHAAEAGGRRRAGTGGQPACCPGVTAHMHGPWPYSRLNFVLSCRSSRHAVHLCVAAQQQHASAAARGERALPAP
jgi:hypothetical protein